MTRLTLAPLEVHELNTVVFAALQGGNDLPPDGTLGQVIAKGGEAPWLPGSPGGTVQAQASVLQMPARNISNNPPLHERLRDCDVIAATIETLELADHDPQELADLEATLLQTIHGTREKIDRTAAVLAAFESEEYLCSMEAQRLIARMDRVAKTRQRLEAYVIEALEGAELTKFDGHTSTLAVAKNPPALAIEPGAVIPAEYMRVPDPPPPPVAVPDKIRIKNALKHGAAIAGCRLTQGLRLVRS